MKNLKITRVVLAILALVGFSGVKAGYADVGLKNQWKNYIQSNPNVDLSSTDGFNSFNQSDQNELTGYQQSLSGQAGNQSFGSQNSFGQQGGNQLGNGGLSQEEWPTIPQINQSLTADAYPTTATTGQMSDSADAGLMQQWKEYIQNNPGVNLSSTEGFSSFNQADQATLQAYQQSIAGQNDDDGEEEPWDTSDEGQSGSTDASPELMQQWKEYIKNNNLNKAELEASQGFDSFNQSDQSILLGYALKQAIDTGVNNLPVYGPQPKPAGYVSPTTGTQSKWNNFKTGAQGAGQWAVNTEIGQGVTQEVKEIKTELYNELAPDIKDGSKAAVRGVIGWAINKLIKKLGAEDEYKAQQQKTQGAYPGTGNQQQPTYYQGPQPKGVQPGTVQQPKLYPGNRGVLVQPGVNVKRTPAGPPPPPGGGQKMTPQFSNSKTTPLMNNGGYNTSPTAYSQPSVNNSVDDASQGLTLTAKQRKFFNAVLLVITNHPEYEIEKQIGWELIGSAGQQRLKEIQQSFLNQDN